MANLVLWIEIGKRRHIDGHNNCHPLWFYWVLGRWVRNPWVTAFPVQVSPTCASYDAHIRRSIRWCRGETKVAMNLTIGKAILMLTNMKSHHVVSDITRRHSCQIWARRGIKAAIHTYWEGERYGMGELMVLHISNCFLRLGGSVDHSAIRIIHRAFSAIAQECCSRRSKCCGTLGKERGRPTLLEGCSSFLVFHLAVRKEQHNSTL